ncbi:hypothetical protein PIB30_063680, partial [Stylosanthes scabra]|nr:hypothetical protein [Stylosanthes scabra]
MACYTSKGCATRQVLQKHAFHVDFDVLHVGLACYTPKPCATRPNKQNVLAEKGPLKLPNRRNYPRVAVIEASASPSRLVNVARR